MTASGKRLSARSPRFEIEITPEIIETSCRADSGHCMIADALKAARPDAKHVMVDLQTIRFTDTEKRQRYIYFTPRLGQDALIAFDQGEKVEPFKLTLMSAAQVVRAGEGPGGPATLKRPGRGPKNGPKGGGSRALVKVGGTPPPISPLAHGHGVEQAEALGRPNVFASLASRGRTGNVEQAEPVNVEQAEPVNVEQAEPVQPVGQPVRADAAEPPPGDIEQPPPTQAATEASANRRLDQKVGRRREWGLRAMKR